MESNCLRINGFNKGQKILSKYFNTINEGKTYVDGHRLDRIEISLIVFSPADIKELITLLHIASETLHTQGVNHNLER